MEKKKKRRKKGTIKVMVCDDEHLLFMMVPFTFSPQYINTFSIFNFHYFHFYFILKQLIASGFHPSKCIQKKKYKTIQFLWLGWSTFDRDRFFGQTDSNQPQVVSKKPDRTDFHPHTDRPKPDSLTKNWNRSTSVWSAPCLLLRNKLVFNFIFQITWIVIL